MLIIPAPRYCTATYNIYYNCEMAINFKEFLSRWGLFGIIVKNVFKPARILTITIDKSAQRITRRIFTRYSSKSVASLLKCLFFLCSSTERYYGCEFFHNKLLVYFNRQFLNNILTVHFFCSKLSLIANLHLAITTNIQREVVY